MIANRFHRHVFDLPPEDPVRLLEDLHSRQSDSHFDVHYELEVGLVCSGAMLRHYTDTRIRLGPGDVWLTGMWESHGFTIDTAPCGVQVFIIRPDFLASENRFGPNWLGMFSLAPSERPRVRREDRARVLETAARIRLDAAREPVFRRRSLWLHLYEILLLLSAGAPEIARDQATMQADAYSCVQPAVRLVLTEGRYVPVEKAARACRLGRNAFAQLFARVMGLSFREFALRHRLSGAGRDLQQTDKPLKAIAADWGFADPSHLHRCFVRHYGLKPGEYRKTAPNAHA